MIVESNRIMTATPAGRASITISEKILSTLLLKIVMLKAKIGAFVWKTPGVV